jgi:peroxiredoxin
MFKNDYMIVREFGATVLAVSADKLASHVSFAERMGGLPFPLGSDEDLEVARLYGVADEEARRSRRAVFIIDETGMVVHAQAWFQPGNAKHYAAVFSALGLDLD